MPNSKSELAERLKARITIYINHFTDSYKTRILIVSPFILGLLVGSLWMIIGKKMFGTLPHVQNLIMAYITFFIWGFSGVVIIVKREVPGTFISIKGVHAIIIGLMETAFCWGIAFRGIYLLLTHLTQ